jgi:hypothetical protein
MPRPTSRCPPNFEGPSGGDEFSRTKSRSLPESLPRASPRCRGGAIFKIEVTDLESGATQRREIRPDYFIVTDDRIILLNEEDNEAAVKKISAMDKPPAFEPGDVYGITTGKFNHEDGLWKTTISPKSDLCVYDSSHPSGHFKKIVWKKGVGLVEYASGSGAHADGYRLKRER